ETLKVITMVYAGYINKNLVAKLQSLGCNAIGLCGADANIIKAHKRIHPTIDYGYVGDIDHVDTGFFKILFNNNVTPVFAPVTHDENGLLNTNADSIAKEIASAMSQLYHVHLVYCFEKSGVLMEPENDNSTIAQMNEATYLELKNKKIISSGMIPKLDNSFDALKSGVQKVLIGNADKLHDLLTYHSGTAIVHE
ncbi:MAG TPA: acetylglutamate kinase, partial [Ferruginibacter sp.]|nr:acetylglutamate kinase [Ferruginibacter sp.]